MDSLVSYLGAAISTIAAVAAWFFNHEMKKYEIMQARAAAVLEKRFECYPRLWELCQSFLTDLAGDGVVDPQRIDALCTDLVALYQRDGLFYSESLQLEIEGFIADSRTSAASEWFGIEVLKNRLTGNSRHVGILRRMRDDLGGYVTNAASVVRDAR